MDVAFTPVCGSAPFSSLLCSLTPPWFRPPGPFSQCHREVAPHSSFTSCVYGQCGSKGNALTLCRSLQAYAVRCTLASWAPSWHNSTFCPECPALLPHGPKKPLAPQVLLLCSSLPPSSPSPWSPPPSCSRTPCSGSLLIWFHLLPH